MLNYKLFTCTVRSFIFVPSLLGQIIRHINPTLSYCITHVICMPLFSRLQRLNNLFAFDCLARKTVV